VDLVRIEGPGVIRHIGMDRPSVEPPSGTSSDGARIKIENESDVPIRSFYFYIATIGSTRNPRTWPGFMRSGEGITHAVPRDNYLILGAEGREHYVGTVLSAHNLYGSWWGEGKEGFGLAHRSGKA